MGEPGVGQGCKPLKCLGVIGDDGLTGHVAAGHHQCARPVRIAGQAEQQVVHRGVRKHDSQVGAARCHRVRECALSWLDVNSASQQDDRPNATPEKGPLGRTDVHEVLDVGEALRHHRERLVAPPFAAAQRGHGLGVPGVAGEVVAADALDGEDGTGGQQRACLLDRVDVGVRSGRRVHEAQARAAGTAGDGLGVESPVSRVRVLACAVGAHREAGHGGVRSVVRESGDDGEARPAVCARDERVPVPTVTGVGHFGEARAARGRVRGDERARRSLRTRGDDGESAAASEGDLLVLHGLHHGQRRGLLSDPVAEPCDGGVISLDLGDDAVFGVGHVPRQLQRRGQGVQERPEPDALDDTTYRDATALSRLGDGVAGLKCAHGRGRVMTTSSRSSWW